MRGLKSFILEIKDGVLTCVIYNAVGKSLAHWLMGSDGGGGDLHLGVVRVSPKSWQPRIGGRRVGALVHIVFGRRDGNISPWHDTRAARRWRPALRRGRARRNKSIMRPKTDLRARWRFVVESDRRRHLSRLQVYYSRFSSRKIDTYRCAVLSVFFFQGVVFMNSS